MVFKRSKLYINNVKIAGWVLQGSGGMRSRGEKIQKPRHYMKLMISSGPKEPARTTTKHVTYLQTMDFGVNTLIGNGIMFFAYHLLTPGKI